MEKRSTVVFSWGRLNPPTKGHEKLVSLMRCHAKLYNTRPVLFLSHSHDINNPLKYDYKLILAKRLFGSVVVESTINNILDIARLYDTQYDQLVMVVGSDRAKTFETLLNKYNNDKYFYDSIRVISAGDRTKDNYSASNARKFVLANNFEKFSKLIPKKLRLSAPQIFQTIKESNNLFL